MKKIFWLFLVVLAIPLWGQNERWAEEYAKDLAGWYRRYYSGQSYFFTQYGYDEIRYRLDVLYHDVYIAAVKKTRTLGHNFFYGMYTDEEMNWALDRMRSELHQYAYTRVSQLFPVRERRGYWDYAPGNNAPVLIRGMPERDAIGFCRR